MNDSQYSQTYTNNLRYSLAKKKLDVHFLSMTQALFIKWLRSNKDQV